MLISHNGDVATQRKGYKKPKTNKKMNFIP